MLNNLIAARVDAWFRREDCPARHIVAHIEQAGHLRRPQIEAIKTYLFLKIEGQNRPLADLFCDGSLIPNEALATLHISQKAREHLEADPAARTLFAFARMKNSNGTGALLPQLETYLRDHGPDVDCDAAVRKMFYGVQYPDYLFSLPMGAGKTFLMAAFIYLDLYFAQSAPDNKTFAHNFILLVPSGLKSSIIPSLKTIENFDPAWVLPEPAAGNVRKLIRFEILDQPKSGKKSNKARNPNAQKISSHQPFADLMGLVLVTNAEKVILDKVKVNAQGELDLQTDGERDKAANELRHIIGQIPNLQILIDEVHHAATDDIQLRRVVNQWHRGGNINGVLGFSGTPYLSSGEDVKLTEDFAAKFPQITNTVFYYPLTRAIKEFLKKPDVKVISELDSNGIVRRGVEEFLAKYGAKEYEGGQTAKLAIYCGSIERLEEQVYPLLREMGVDDADILKYHRGNAQYKTPAGADTEWRLLDTAQSRKRVILLVQIGKEGWDCRSLTGVILSQKGDCPTNMVLQTSCRCLRQMDKSAASEAGKEQIKETAGIWLNAENAKSLDKQLKDEQQTSIKELNALGKMETPPTRPRFSRMDTLRLPPLDFYQFQVEYDTVTTEPANPQAQMVNLDAGLFHTRAYSETRSLTTGESDNQKFFDVEQGETADFSGWLLSIAKGSFGGVTTGALREFAPQLRVLFDAITYTKRGTRYFNALYDADALVAQVRLAFHARRELETRSEIVPASARLLVVEKLRDVAENARNLYPSQADCDKIRELDEKGQSAELYAQSQREAWGKVMEAAKAQGFDTNLFNTPPAEPTVAVQNKDRSFHFAPYQFDSGFELEFLQKALIQESLRERELEIYFNGAGDLTEFRIECYAQQAGRWSKVGKYTPDFLLVERRDNAIHRALIIETKGSGYAEQREFKARRHFVETEFLRLNNDRFGYPRFDYLYLSDADDLQSNLHKLCQKATEFFTT